jgi:hypothetical protein
MLEPKNIDNSRRWRTRTGRLAFGEYGLGGRARLDDGVEIEVAAWR